MDEALGKVARKQWGVFSRAQAVAQGLAAWTIRRRVQSGQWFEVEAGVYRFRGGHESWHQKVCAATLSLPGAMASHGTAAFLWGLEGLGGAPALIEVTVGFAVSRRLTLARVHHSRRIPDPAERRDRIATTPLTRTLIDLSDVLNEERLFVAFDSARRKFGGLLPALEEELKLNGSGRRNRNALMSMVQRAKGESATESPLEARAMVAMTRFGLPRPTLQHAICDERGKLIARVDFAWIPQRVILQCDSHQWHLTPAAFEKDLRQRRQLESRGWRVVHVTWNMLESRDWLVDLGRLLEAQSTVALGGYR